MDYRQYRRVRRLVHECCNYIDGNCIALDDGEECVCVQSISYSLLCRWFRAAVLPQDKELETALFHRLNAKKWSKIIIKSTASSTICLCRPRRKSRWIGYGSIRPSAGAGSVRSVDKKARPQRPHLCVGTA